MDSKLPIRYNPSAQASLESHANRENILASWSKAVDLFNSQLTRDEKKKIDDAVDLRGIFPDLLASANSIRDKVDASRHSWTPTLHNIVNQINRFAVVGDIIVQHHAEYTSLVWGTMRFLLIFAVEEPKVFEKIREGLHSVTQIVFRAEKYAELFSTPAGPVVDAVFESLHENLTRLYAEVLSYLVRSTMFFRKSSKRRFVSAGIFSDTKFQAILDNISRYENNVEKDKNLLESEARKKQEQYENGIWLQAADFTADLKKRKDDHLESTCTWFFDRDEYAGFKGTPEQPQTQFLWISGKPGCGKSILAAQIIDDLSSDADVDLVTYVFCKSGLERRNTLGAILRNLVFQLLAWTGAKPLWHRSLLSLRQTVQKDSVECTEQIWHILEQMIRVPSGGKYVFVLDAIDECDCTKNEWQSFVSRLTKVFRRNRKAKIVSTSQLELPDSEPISGEWSVLKIQSADVESDIRIFSENRLNRSKELFAHPEKAKLLKTIVVNCDGMILWAKLMIRELEFGRWKIAKVLKEAPRGLKPLYQTILQRTLADERTAERNRTAIGISLVAMRPLRCEELALSIAISEGLESYEEYRAYGNPVDEAKQIIEECSPLLTIMPDNTIQLVHSSLKQILFSQPTFEIAGFSFQEDLLQSQMSFILLKYMSFDCVADDAEAHINSSPELAEYGSKFLFDHCVKTTDSRTTQHLTRFLLSTQGWKYIRKMTGMSDMTFAHLSLMAWQSKLCSTMQHATQEESSVLRNFLELTAQKRIEDLKDAPKTSDGWLEATANLASVRREQGRWNEAEALQKEVLKIRKQILGERHQDTLIMMDELARTQLKLRLWDEVKELLSEVVTVRKQIQGENHPNTLASMHDLAIAYFGLKRIKEAVELSEVVIERRRQVLGSDHPRTLLCMGNLAVFYSDQGLWEQAEKLQKEVMETTRQVLGDEHPESLLVMSNLAGTYARLGRYKEAEVLISEAIEKRKRVMGSDHPNVLLSQYHLAEIYQGQERWEEAEALLTEVLKKRKELMDSDRSEALADMQNPAWIYIRQERWKEAEELQRESLEHKRRTLGDKHPDTFDNIAGLIIICYRTGRHEEAIKLLRDLLSVQEQVYGADHPTVTTNREILASWLDDSD